MKVGDLVKLKKHCKDPDRLALIIEIPAHLGAAKILYVDIGELKSALKANLELVSESR